MTQLIRIINHINKLNNDDEILDYLYTFQYINKIFNHSNEQIQIDFIKQLLNKIKSKEKFKDSLPLFKMQNIYTINKLLDWGIDYNDYNICYFVLNHKDKNVYITINEYTEFENRTNNKELSLLFSEFRMKESYNMELYSTSDSDSETESFYDSDTESFYDSDSDTESFYESDSETESIYSNSDDEIRTRDIKTIEDVD
jgi:hypothetical protein